MCVILKIIQGKKTRVFIAMILVLMLLIAVAAVLGVPFSEAEDLLRVLFDAISASTQPATMPTG